MRDIRHVKTVLGTLGALVLASNALAAGNFGYRKAITLSGVVGGPHASFPVLVSMTYPELQTGVASPSGHDVVFRGEDPATCGGPALCTLDHEIEMWDGDTGTLVAWVRVPSLSAGTVIYMYYGDSQIASSTEATQSVWDADYVGVWHLKEAHNAAVNGYRDSARYGNHGRGGKGDPLAAPQPVPDGGIGFGQHFDQGDGTYDFIDGGDDGTLHVASDQITLQAWVRHNIVIDAPHGTPPSVANGYGILNHKGFYDGYSLMLEADSALCPGGPITRPCLRFNLPGRTHSLKTTQAASLGPGQWHHVVATYDGVSMQVFVDGVPEGGLPKTGNVAPSTGDQAMWIGHGDQPDGQAWSAQYEGDLDEVRISRVARSPDWVATEYVNQKDPMAFHAVGPEVPGPFPLPTPMVNYRSIGASGPLYAAGDASVAAGGTIVTFGGGASLPGNVRRGDALTFLGPPTETLHILSRDSTTQVTVQSPATAAHAAQAYTIDRAFNDLVAWEAAREGDLVGDNRRETGIVYEGPLPGGLIFSGSNTDPVRSWVLTVAPASRHQGVAGTGAIIDNGASPTPAIQILDDHVTVEWLEIKGDGAAPAHGIEFVNGINPANLGTVRYNLIHHLDGDGIRLGAPDAIVDIYGNIVYETHYGIRLPVDLTPAARVNVFSNTIYATHGAAGPSGIKSDVRQTSVRLDLRNNIAHSSPNGDFGVSPFFDLGWFCNPFPACVQVANGGILGPLEQLADRTNAMPLAFGAPGDCLYMGSFTKFRGVNVFLAAPGAPLVADLQWDYWNGIAWANLEGSFADGTGHLQWNGAVYWPDDPAGWALTPVVAGPALYYVRACLAVGAYGVAPQEAQITRIDVSMASRNNLSSDVTGRPHSVLWGGSTGRDSVALPLMLFGDTNPGTEDLHLNVGSAAENMGTDLLRRFSADIDGALWADPWDIGADEASVNSGPDLSITKDDLQTTAVPGTPVSYTITVTNNGPGLLTSARVFDTLPLEIRGPLFTPSVGVYDSASGIWGGLDLGSSQSATLTLQGTIAPWARGTLFNLVDVAPPEGVDDPAPGNNSDSDADTLDPSVDLALTKTDDIDPAEIGGLLTYTLTVTNLGPSEATGVTLTDPLPPEVEFDSATPGGCSYDVPTRVVTCPLGNIPFPGSAFVTLTVRPMVIGMIANSASVAGVETDPASGNNSAGESTMVTGPSVGVSFFTVTSTSQTNVLEWLNPVTDYDRTEIVFRTDRFPTGPGDGTQLVDGGSAGAVDSYPHDTGAGSNGQTHYYGAFVHRTAAPLLSAGRFVSGRPFDNSNAVKWAFSTGVFSITPPTVGGSAVIAPSNDHVLYAMDRGDTGGTWPAGWVPVQLGGPVQSRSPVVPITVGTTNPVVYLGAQDGNVYVADAALGGPSFPWGPTSIAGTVQAAPAGIFSAFGGAYDYLLVGTRDDGADNKFFVLNPFTGATIGLPFDNGGGANGIGIINGMATIDYGNARVYFASHEKQPTGSTDTLWCLDLQTPSPDAFAYKWSRPLGNIAGSPVLRGGRVYAGGSMGAGTGSVYSINAASGLGPDWTFPHADGPVKGFVWPDRASTDLYFATDNFVWGISDTGVDPMPNKFASGISLGGGATPSAVLFDSGSQHLYVGGSDGKLYEIDVSGAVPALKSVVLGDGLATVGAPSLDWPNGLIHVGTEAGIFYAVEVPLP